MTFDSLSSSSPNYVFLLWIALFMTITVVVVGVCITIVTSLVFLKSNTDNKAIVFSTMLERANALQMATVILIIVGACSLRIVDDISSEAVVSILSGVAGYVLGGSAPLFRTARSNDGKEGN